MSEDSSNPPVRATAAAAASRRRVLGLALGGLTAVPEVAFAAPPGGAGPVSGPDAGLIDACLLLDALLDEEDALLRGVRTIEAEEAVEAELDALQRRQQGAIDAVCRLHATTPGGHLARARTVVLVARPIDPAMAGQPDAPWDQRVIAALKRDLLAWDPAGGTGQA